MAEPAANGLGGGPRGMGRGLEAILSTSSREESGLRDIPTELIRPNPTQPRREFDDEALLALAESVKARGILQPVVVRPLAGGNFELVAGERRLRQLGVRTVVTAGAGVDEIAAAVAGAVATVRTAFALPAQAGALRSRRLADIRSALQQEQVGLFRSSQRVRYPAADGTAPDNNDF